MAVVPVVQPPHVGLDNAHAALRRRRALHKAVDEDQMGGHALVLQLLGSLHRRPGGGHAQQHAVLGHVHLGVQLHKGVAPLHAKGGGDDTRDAATCAAIALKAFGR